MRVFTEKRINIKEKVKRTQKCVIIEDVYKI